MKKFIIAAAVLMAAVRVYAGSGQFAIPASNTSQPAPIGYGGVDISTNTFSTNFTTVSAKPCRVYGVLFSSGLPTDFADLYATGTWNPGSQGGVSTATARIYNMANSTGTSVQNGGLAIYSGFVPVGPNPLRFSGGLGWKMSVNTQNNPLLEYMCEDK